MQRALNRTVATVGEDDFEFQFEQMLGALDARPRVVVDRAMAVRWRSDNAGRLLARPFPVTITDGVLGAGGGNADAALKEFVEDIGSTCDTLLVRRQESRHWAMVIGWAMQRDPDLVCLLMNLSVPHRGVEESGLARALRLTATETRVLDHFARLNSPREIASEMDISLSTVRSHLKQIHSKAGVVSAVQLTQLVRGYCSC